MNRQIYEIFHGPYSGEVILAFQGEDGLYLLNFNSHLIKYMANKHHFKMKKNLYTDFIQKIHT